MPNQVVDPWLEPDGFSSPILYSEAYGRDEPDGLEIHPGLDPEVVVVEGGVPKVEPVAEPEPEGPEVFQIGDDGTVTLEKEKGQWKCTLESGSGGQPQVYWGKTKNELIATAMGKAQLNATKKIRELNAKLKLGGAPPPKPTPVVAPSVKTLSADEIFEIKTQLDSNPDLALSNWFQKATGLSVQQLVGLAQKGANADASLETEAIGKEFMGRNPDYFASMPNLNRLIQWLGKFKLGNPSAGMNELYVGGVWTVENLEEAFHDLSEDGFLAKAPKPVVTAPEPVPQPRPEERIVRTETRPRAALGLRTNDVSPTPLPEAPKAPSVEDLDSMTDQQVKDTLNAIRRQKILSRRS